MQPWYLYAPPHGVNDATAFYIETIRRSARALGRELSGICRLGDIPARGDALVIDCKHALKLKLARPGVAQWNWLQGVVPEEARLHFGSRVRQTYWEWFERLALPRAHGVFMVSRAMQQHYRRKYGFDRLPTFIMPCVNQRLDPAAFLEPQKYVQPRFVYAGSMHRWQCFELTLEAFGLIRRALPQASLTVLTGEQDRARAAIQAAGLGEDAGVELGYVRAEELPQVLRRFKYGFVLRQEHVVNAVATPTKVSSYMAAGVIPVMCRTVHDYAERLADTWPVVFADQVTAESVCRAVLALESRHIDPSRVAASYGTLFEQYFNHDGYVDALSSFLADTGLRRG